MSISCILATSREAELTDLIAGLKGSGSTVTITADGAAALAAVEQSSPNLVIIDEGLPDFKPLPLVVKVIMANALTNTAVITSMDDREFHDKSEGFGVLRALPPIPTQKDGEDLAAQVTRVMNLA